MALGSLREAGTVHLGADGHGLTRWLADLNTATVPDNPFMLFGQMTTADPSRSPAGTESAWAYTHLPRERNDNASADRLTQSVDRVVEEHAPGFASTSWGGSVQRPSDLQAADANLSGGASTVGLRSCSNNSSSGHHPASDVPRPRCATSSSEVPQHIPAAVCTGYAVITPPTRH